MSDSVMEIDGMGNKVWRNLEGEYHRIGGPAIEYKCGDKCWYQNGQLHRKNGPAIEWYSSDYKLWYINGKWLGNNEKGFWAFWDTLTPEQKQDPVLLSHLPGDFNV